jgi:hypothetical protein
MGWATYSEFEANCPSLSTKPTFFRLLFSTSSDRSPEYTSARGNEDPLGGQQTQGRIGKIGVLDEDHSARRQAVYFLLGHLR